MKDIFNKFKVKAEQNKVGLIAWGVTSFSLATNVVAHAATGVADSSVTTAFDTASANILATLGVVSLSGVGIMVVIMGWRYGKKLFKVVAN
jgi:hypothetical protein